MKQCVILPPHQIFYTLFKEYMHEKDECCCICGGAALAQEVLNLSKREVQFSDIDLFCSDTTFNVEELKVFLESFFKETGCRAIIKMHRNFGLRDNEVEEYRNFEMSFLADIELFYGRTRGDKVKGNMQVICTPYRDSYDQFWTGVVDAFDISVSKFYNVSVK